MDFGRAFSYVFEDDDWLKKVLLGGIINLVPILNFASSGYFLEVIQKTAWKQELPLPDWSNLGEKWVKGLIFAIIVFIYSLPGTILMTISMIPLMLASMAGSERGAGLAAGGTMVFMLLGVLWFIFILLLMPAISVQYALYGNFGAAFRFGEIIKFITQDIGGYVMAIVAVLAVGAISSIVSMIPLVGWVAAIFVYFYALLVGGNAVGQLGQSLVRSTSVSSSQPSES